MSGKKWAHRGRLRLWPRLGSSLGVVTLLASSSCLPAGGPSGDIRRRVPRGNEECFNTRTEYGGSSHFPGVFALLSYDSEAPPFIRFRVARFISVVDGRDPTTGWMHYEYCLGASTDAPSGWQKFSVRFYDAKLREVARKDVAVYVP